MYYSKNASQRNGGRLVIPSNYGGNAFKVKDETDRREVRPPYDPPESEEMSPHILQADASSDEPSPADAPENERSFSDGAQNGRSDGGFMSALLQRLTLEDILLFALVFLTYRDDPDDDILLLLIILVFLK